MIKILLFCVSILLIGCEVKSTYESFMTDAKRPIIVVAKSNGGADDYPTATLRDSLNNTIFINYEAARQIVSSYKVGDTIK